MHSSLYGPYWPTFVPHELKAKLSKPIVCSSGYGTSELKYSRVNYEVTLWLVKYHSVWSNLPMQSANSLRSMSCLHSMSGFLHPEVLFSGTASPRHWGLKDMSFTPKRYSCRPDISGDLIADNWMKYLEYITVIINYNISLRQFFFSS